MVLHACRLKHAQAVYEPRGFLDGIVLEIVELMPFIERASFMERHHRCIPQLNFHLVTR